MEFYLRLQDLRKKSGMTQERLAEKLGITRQTVSKWERGESTPDFAYLVKISNLFHVSTDYLLKGELLQHKQLPSPERVTTEGSQNQNSHMLGLLGACMFLGGLITNVVLFVLSVLYPVDWIGNIGSYIVSFDGLMGFLFWKNIVWLFALMCLAIVIGVVLMILPFIKSHRQKRHYPNP